MDDTTILDCMGMNCPMPLVKLNEIVGESSVGTLIEVWSDDEGSKVDIPVWCRMRGHELVQERTREEGGWAFLVKTAS